MKQLDWILCRSPVRTYIAYPEGVKDFYIVKRTPLGTYWKSTVNCEELGVFATEEAAKEAAQLDFNQKVQGVK